MAYREPIDYSFAGRYTTEALGTEDNAQKIQQDRYRTAQLAHAAAAGQREEAEAAKADTVFGGVEGQLRSDRSGTSPATYAYGYARAIADIKSYVANGDLESANRVYASRLRDPATKYHNEFIDFGTARARNKTEAAVQIGAQNISLGLYDNEQVSVNGQAMTLGSLFRDGNAFKSLQRDSILQRSFSKPVVESYNSDDPFRQGIFRTVVNPVLQDGGNHPYRFQHTRLATYLQQNFDGLKEDLGEEGMKLAVNDAVDNRVKNGTELDRLRSLRTWVANQANANPNADRFWLVEQGLSQFSGSAASSLTTAGGKPPSPSAERFHAKVMNWTLNDPRYAGVTVDFNSDAVRSQMAGISKFVATADRLRVPFLVEANQGGAPVRNAISELVHAASSGEDVSASNFIEQANQSLESAMGLLSGGCTPAARNNGSDPSADGPASSVFGSTSGSESFDSTRRAMLRTLWGENLLQSQSRGMRADVAFRTLCTPGSDERNSLVRGWARDIAETSLLTPETSAILANGFANEIFRPDGTVRAPDMFGVMSRLAFDKKFGEEHPAQQKELLRWFKSEKLMGPMMADAHNEILPYLTDTLVGQGLKTSGEIASALAKFDSFALALAEKGRPYRHAIEAVKRQGRWLVPSGASILADGSRALVVSDEEFRKMKDAAKTRGEQLPRDIVSSADRRALGRRPELVQASGDLDQADIPSVVVDGVATEQILPGDWSKNPNKVRQVQMMLQKVMEDNRKIGAARAGKAAKDSLSDQE